MSPNGEGARLFIGRCLERVKPRRAMLKRAKLKIAVGLGIPGPAGVNIVGSSPSAGIAGVAEWPIVTGC